MSAGDAGRGLASQWTSEFASVIEAMADQRPDMTVAEEAGAAMGADGALWWKQPLDAVEGAAVWVAAPTATWTDVAKRILAAAGIDEADEGESRGTWLELVKQAIGGLAMRIGEKLGREVTTTGGSEDAAAGDGTHFSVTMRMGGEELPPLEFRLSAQLLAVLAGPAPGAQAAQEQQQPEHAAMVAAMAAAAAQSAGDEGNEELGGRACRTLEILLDVDMPVSVSFGRTQVKVQDVLKLITGSIVELERTIAEPVDVIVNNCVIARGEVVVVEGNYGVRINEIMSKRERLQQSRKYLLPVHR